MQEVEKMEESAQKSQKVEIVWKNVLLMLYIHLTALFALAMFRSFRIETWVWEFALSFSAGLGVTAGAHRLWAHRSYKAKLPLRIFLAWANTLAVQNSIIEWSRDHRGHHKYTETNADPHNAKRGFFFAHVGWLLVRKHPDVIRKGKGLDLSDLYNDPVAKFQDKNYKLLVVVMAIAMPTLVPLLWGETLFYSYLACLLRMCFIYNATWLVNSAAHLYGNRPYDKTINPRQNTLVSFLALGEGFHNYHHVFPYDYSTSEFGLRINITTLFINLMRHFGLAYDCRKVDPEIIISRRKRTGDLSGIAEKKYVG